jgi:hypothetical protein
MGNTEIKEAEYYPVLSATIVSHKNIENKYTVYVIQVPNFVPVQKRFLSIFMKLVITLQIIF